MANGIQLKQMWTFITNKKSFISYDYQLCGQVIQKVSSVKYLGVTFDQHLTWKVHNNNLCSRANSTKAFLQRNVSHCPVSIMSTCYQTFVRSIIEYSAPVWSPHTKCDIMKLKISSKVLHVMLRMTILF